MFISMSEFPTHNPYPDQDNHHSPVPEPEQPKPAGRKPKVSPGKPPAGLDTRAARTFARRVLSTRQVLDTIEPSDVTILERVTGERKTTRGDLDELAVVLSAPGDSGAGKDVLTSTRDLLSKVGDDAMGAVVDATMLAADSPDVFREVFALTRELGVHDTPRAPSGHEVKAASALVQAARDGDVGAALARIEALTDLLA